MRYLGALLYPLLPWLLIGLGKPSRTQFLFLTLLVSSFCNVCVFGLANLRTKYIENYREMGSHAYL